MLLMPRCYCPRTLAAMTKGRSFSAIAECDVAKSPMHAEGALFRNELCGRAGSGGFAPAPQGFSALVPLPMRALCRQTDERGCRSIPLNRLRPLSRRSGCFPAWPYPPLSPGSFYGGGKRGASLRWVLKGSHLTLGESGPAEESPSPQGGTQHAESQCQVYRARRSQGSDRDCGSQWRGLVMESIVETKASTLLDFLHGLRGELHVTLEEGTWAAWLYDVLKPHVQKIVVCNPRRNALLKRAARATEWMRGSWPSCYGPECCARSTTERTDCGHCGSWRVVI